MMSTGGVESPKQSKNETTLLFKNFMPILLVSGITTSRVDSFAFPLKIAFTSCI